MIDVHVERTIHSPIERVFRRLSDIERYAEWMPPDSILRACTKDTPGAVGPGTTYTDRTRYGTARGEVVTFEPPTRIVFHYVVRRFGVVAMEGWPAYVLEAAGPDRTVLHHSGTAVLYGPVRLCQPILQRIADRERRVTVDALARSLESTVAGRRS